MFADTVENLKTELVEIMDRIDMAVRDKTITEQQRVDAEAARDFIYVGFTRLKHIFDKEKK